MTFPDSAPCAFPVSYRTYSRKDTATRETWDQVCDRALRGLKKLGRLTPQEYQLVHDALRAHHFYPSGRWLWVGGTPWVEDERNVLGAYNCVSIEPEGFEDFGLLADLAMQGCGTGAVLEESVLAKPPIIQRQLAVTTVGKPGDVPARDRSKITFTKTTDPATNLTIMVGDSRQGWVDAYTALLNAAVTRFTADNEPLPVTVVLGHVRPLGEPLKGFGGVANPVELPPLFGRVANVLNKAHGRRLNFMEACLVIDEMARTIVAGNLRRCLPEDALVHTKRGLIPIKDVVISDMVQTPLGFRWVTDKFDQGVQDVYEIPCDHPTLPRATLNHRVAVVVDEGDYDWKTVSDLEEGDLLLYSPYEDYSPEAGIAANTIVRVLGSPKFHSTVHTYDIEVEEAHCFYCDGYLNHNSAGIRQGGEAAATSKLGLWKQDEDGNWSIDPERDALRMANHTRVFHQKPTLEQVIEAVRSNYYSGEGAIQYAPEAIARCNPDLVLDRELFFYAYENGEGAEYLAQSALEQGIALEPGELEHRLGRYGLNPCGEIIGKRFACNLGEVNLNMIDPQDVTAQLRAFEAGAISVCALLYHKFPDPGMQQSREWDPIVAVCPTGLFDFFVKAFGRRWLEWWQAGRPTGWGEMVLWTPLFSSFSQSTSEEVSESEFFLTREREYLAFWREVVEDAVTEFCDRRGLKRPNRCTSVQPSGTKALLTGASPGWHPPKATRFIRRISMRRGEPVAMACRDYGYNIVPAQSAKDEEGNLLNDPMDPRCHEWLVEIPVEVPWADVAEGIDLSQFSALAQFDFYMQVQRHYTGHNTSATLELREPEIEPLAQAIHEAMGKGYISAAILARFDDLESFPRLPFEPIDQATYQVLCQEVLARRVEPDFEKALASYDAQGAVQMVAGPAPCDSGGCLLK